MRSLTIIAFVALVIVAALGVELVQSLEHRFEARVCAVVISITTPIVKPADADAGTLGRIDARNSQLAAERHAMLHTLGKDHGC